MALRIVISAIRQEEGVPIITAEVIQPEVYRDDDQSVPDPASVEELKAQRLMYQRLHLGLATLDQAPIE